MNLVSAVQGWRYRRAARQIAGALTPEAKAYLQGLYARMLGDKHPATPSQAQSNRGWAYAINRQIGGRGARVKAKTILNLCTRGGAGPVKKTRVYDHPFLDLMGQPNPQEAGGAYIWRQLIQLNTQGKNHILVVPEVFSLAALGIKDTVSRLASMYLLDPALVVPKMTRFRVEEYQFAGEGSGPVWYKPAPGTEREREDWKRNPTPFVVTVTMPIGDSMIGSSPLQAGEHAVNADWFLGLLHQNQLRNGLHTGMIFKMLQDIPDLKRFEAQVLLLRAGLGHAGEPLVLPKNIDVDKNPVSNDSMKFADLDVASRKEILAVEGGSDGAVGIVTDVNRANQEGLERMLAQGTVDPMMALIAECYNTFILPIYRGQSDKVWYELEFPSVAIADEVTEAELDAKLVGDKPIMTVNEIRERRGLAKLPGGDDLTPTKTAGSSIDSLLNSTSSLAQIPKPSNMKAADLPALERGDCGCGGKRDDGLGETAPVQKGEVLALPVDHVLATVEGRTARWSLLTNEQRAHERAFRKAMTPVFKQWREATTAYLKTAGAATVLGRIQNPGPPVARRGVRDGEDPLNTKTWTDALATAYAAPARAALVAAANRIFSDLGVDATLDAASPVVDLFVTRRAAKFAGYVVDTQLELLREAVADAIEEDNPAAIVTAASETFPTGTDPRLFLMAVVEVGIAAGAGAYEAASEARDEHSKNPGLIWISQRDAKVRASHVAADGQVIRLGEAFQVGGCLMRYPHDAETCGDMSEIANCRCHAVAINL